MFVKSSALNTLLALITIGVSLVIFNPFLSFASTEQSVSENRQALTRNSHTFLPAQTLIPIRYDLGEKILLTKEETMELSLQVAKNVTNSNGQIIIPDGSEIIGKIKPTGVGSQFFSQKILLKLNNNKSYTEQSLNAISPVINKIETLVQGINPETLDNITQNAVLGSMAANLLAAFREDSGRRQSEILGLSDLEALAGWLLGRKTLELVSINPEQDLQLTLQSDFVLDEQ